MTVKSPKKLIEVALPLDDINFAAAREKSIRHGHPSTLHLWWARRPLAAARDFHGNIGERERARSRPRLSVPRPPVPALPKSPRSARLRVDTVGWER
jgi:hypothetical protein